MWSYMSFLPTNITSVDYACSLVVFIAIILLTVPLVSYVNIIFNSKIKSKENSSALIKSTPEAAPSATNDPGLSGSPTSLPSANPQELSVLHLTYNPTLVNKSSEEEVEEEEVSSVKIEENIVIRDGENIICKDLKQGNSKSNKNHCRSFSVSYNSYRHKLIEETLQKQYGGGYAPGNVILNLIQLNTVDSSADDIPSNKYEKISFFDDDFIAKKPQISAHDDNNNNNDDDGKTITDRQQDYDIEFLDPLDHFIPRNMRKVSKTETHTETANPSEISIVLKNSVLTRPNTPNTSCQKIIPKRSRDVNFNQNKITKSPFSTPVNSQTPIIVNNKLKSNSNLTTSGVNLMPNILKHKDQPLLITEQLYRRNYDDDARENVVSRTHVEAEKDYLNRIVKNGTPRTKNKNIVEDGRIIRSSLKKSSRQQRGGECENYVSDRTGDFCELRRRSTRDEIKRLTTSKPTIWNNQS